jgi:hypothetical protein
MAKAERGFRYEKRSREDVKARANMRGGGFDSYIKQEFKRYKVRDGKNMVRILPATWEKPKHYGYDIFVNYGIGADNQSYLSLSKMGVEDEYGKDPLVAARKEAQREGDEDTAKALAPRQRVLVWVIDRLDEDEGPQLWDIPFSVDKDFVNLCLDEDTKEVVYPDDPEEGHDLRFYKEGSGLNTKYPGGRMKLQDASPLHEDADVQGEWLDFVKENPVPDCLQYYDADAISAAFDGQVRGKDEDAEEKPKRRGRDDDDEDEKPRSKREAADDDDEDDKPKKPSRRERVQESDDDEPEEKPKRKAVAEDDDGEPENEAPKKSLRERLAERRKSSSKSTDDDDD